MHVQKYLHIFTPYTYIYKGVYVFYITICDTHVQSKITIKSAQVAPWILKFSAPAWVYKRPQGIVHVVPVCYAQTVDPVSQEVLPLGKTVENRGFVQQSMNCMRYL